MLCWSRGETELAGLKSEVVPNGGRSPDIHEDHAEDDTDYIYNTPNRHEYGNQDIQQHYNICQPLLLQEPSGMTPVPLSYPDPSEASKRSSSLLASLSSLPKKDDNELGALLMYMERPTDIWGLCLAPAKKNGRVKPEEESEIREGPPLIESLAEGQGSEQLNQLAWTQRANAHYQPLCLPSDRKGRWDCGGQQG